MDHFAGFDRLLRVCLHRLAPLHLTGPAGFLDQVEYKLKAYTWNLLDAESLDFRLTAAEFDRDRVARAGEFRAREAFRRRERASAPLTPGTLLDEEEFLIEGVVLDHGTPCLAFAFQEKLRVNVWRERLNLLQLPVGPWLNDAKRAVRRGAPDESPIHVRADLSVLLGLLKQHALAHSARTQNRLRGRRGFPPVEHCKDRRARTRRRPALHRDGVSGRGRGARRQKASPHRGAGRHARTTCRRCTGGAVSFLPALRAPRGSTAAGAGGRAARMTAMCWMHARAADFAQSRRPSGEKKERAHRPHLNFHHALRKQRGAMGGSPSVAFLPDSGRLNASGP